MHVTCPYCITKFNTSEFTYGSIHIDSKNDKNGFQLFSGVCPDCSGLIIQMISGRLDYNGYHNTISEGHIEVIYPSSSIFIESEFIPTYITNEYNEALGLLPHSSKASAAISRRLLQVILNDHYNIKANNLYKEIQKFIELPGIPSYLTDAIDAVRVIGNFAAHPIKSTNTGHIVEVNKGEAEWILEVIESLLDFTFIQPEKLKKRKSELNKKLEESGKSTI